MPDPDPSSIFDHVYAEGHALVDEEREGYLAYASSFASAAAETTDGVLNDGEDD
jgi:pyruvate dehydrogenase E1 component alpha subunit